LQDLPIIALTASAMAGDRERLLEAGMNDFIAKPVRVAALYATLTRWLHRRPRGPETHTPGHAGTAVRIRR